MGNGWMDYPSDSQPTADSTAKVANEMTSFQPVFLLARQDDIDLPVLLSSSQHTGTATAEDVDAIRS